jgi:Uma2 family endonuclease
LVTGEDLLRHPEWGPCELIRGKVVPVCRPNFQHGYLTNEIGAEIRNFAKKRKLGLVVSGDAGIYFGRNPDTVRGPDVYFIRAERLPENGLQPNYLDVAPDLCVEIVSSNDNFSDLEDKVSQYLDLGVKVV